MKSKQYKRARREAIRNKAKRQQFEALLVQPETLQKVNKKAVDHSRRYA